MKALRQVIAILALSLLAAATTWWIMGPPQRDVICDPAQLEPGEICLQDIPDDQSVVWVDARSRRDWQRNGVAGSILWNLDPKEDMHAFEAEAVMKIATTPYVVVYCGDEQCGTSKQIAQRILDLDLNAKVSVLHGGWRALSKAGLTPSPSQNP